MNGSPSNGSRYGMVRVQPATHRRLMALAGRMQASLGRRATADLVVNSALDALEAEMPAQPEGVASGAAQPEQ